MTPVWLRICAVLAALWYAFGLFQFWNAYALDTAAAVQAGTITPAFAALQNAIPGPVWGAYALASLAGLCGAILLWLNRNAVLAFALSLLCALGYWIWLFALSGAREALPAEELPIALTVLAVTFALLIVALRRRA